MTFRSCVEIVQTAMQKKKDHGDEDADHEYRDFLRLKVISTFSKEKPNKLSSLMLPVFTLNIF